MTVDFAKAHSCRASTIAIASMPLLLNECRTHSVRQYHGDINFLTCAASKSFDVIAVVDAACERAFRALRCNGNDIIFNRSILVSFDVDFNSRHQMEALTWQEFSQSLKLPLRSQCEQGFSFILEFTTCVSMAIYITL